MQIAIGLFPGLTSLDAVGPYQVFSYLPGADVVVCAARPRHRRRRTRTASLRCRRHVRRRSRSRRARHPRWPDHPQDGPRRRPDHRVDPSCAPAHHVHDVGLHRRVAARRSGPPRRTCAPPPTGRTTTRSVATAPRPPKTASSTKARSSPPPASPPASILHSLSSRAWPARRPLKPSSSASNTTRSPRSTPALPRRHRPTSVTWFGQCSTTRGTMSCGGSDKG